MVVRREREGGREVGAKNEAKGSPPLCRSAAVEGWMMPFHAKKRRARHSTLKRGGGGGATEYNAAAVVRRHLSSRQIEPLTTEREGRKDRPRSPRNSSAPNLKWQMRKSRFAERTSELAQ